jgi:hypothetical protein
MISIAEQANKQPNSVCICIVFIVVSSDLGETQKSALLGKLHLVLTKICPVSEFRRFILRCIGITVGWTDALQFHENVEEDMQVFLCLEGKWALPLFGYVE